MYGQVKEQNASYKKVLLATGGLNEDEKFNICVGLTIRVMLYTGRDAYWKETCNILPFDDTLPPTSSVRVINKG